MDYRDTESFYSNRAERKDQRIARNRRQSAYAKTIIAKGITFAVSFCVVILMISQLASCSTPTPPTLEERWNEATYKTISSLGLIPTKEKGSKIVFVEGKQEDE